MSEFHFKLSPLCFSYYISVVIPIDDKSSLQAAGGQNQPKIFRCLSPSKTFCFGAKKLFEIYILYVSSCL